ncbi:MAG: DUF167 domain-containing protein [Terriglobia bacterium]
MTLGVETRGGVVRFRVKVQARARREEIAGVHDGILRVRVTAPPHAGRANQELRALLAAHLRVSRSSIKIAAGEHSPLKLIEVAGLDPATILGRLLPQPAPASSGAGELE